MLSDEMRYKLMRALEANPAMSQRALSRELGVSLGKINFCLQALIKKGLVKAKNFNDSDNKVAYMYLLTSRGVEQKASLAVTFLKLKINEYDLLRAEIDQLRREVRAAR